MGEEMEGWQYWVDIVTGVAGRKTQIAYAGLHKSLQKEWGFVQRVTPGIGPAFHPVEDDLRNAFLTFLFKGSTSQITGRAATVLPVEQAEIALSNPNQTAGANWTASCLIT